jgi:uncharacterized protein (TIGR02594 family)
MAEFFTALPWGAVIVVFIGMALLQWRLVNALDKALAKSLTPVAPVAPPVIHVNAPTSSAAAPVAVPRPAGAFAAAPPWFLWALHEVGTREGPNNTGPALARYASLAHCGAQGDPWCAIFANAALEASSIPGTRSASSQSFRHHPGFVQLAGPALGAIAVFWRGSPDSGLGHVGFYRGEDAGYIWTLGGNESDMVQIEALPKSGVSFGLVGYWWPKSIRPPQVAPILMPSGSATSVKIAPSDTASPAGVGKQTRILATYFGGQKSAYGPAINDNSPGVALPHRFTGVRPRVRVTNVKTGASVDCDIVDIGPWNIADPYWETNSRPQAETGTDTTGRKTNGAGIDLTLAAAKSIQIDGKGLVDWKFITESPASPNVT